MALVSKNDNWFLQPIGKIFTYLGGACVALMMFVVAIDVILRYGLSMPISFSVEFTQILLLIAIYGKWQSSLPRWPPDGDMHNQLKFFLKFFSSAQMEKRSNIYAGGEKGGDCGRHPSWIRNAQKGIFAHIRPETVFPNLSLEQKKLIQQLYSSSSIARSCSERQAMTLSLSLII